MSMLRLLVVEDETLVARDLQATLGQLGYEVVAAVGTVEEALAVVEHSRPDLVLMDIRLGDGGDGIQAARHIQQEYFVPVVYLTAHADEATIERARETQPYGYLLKPFHAGELRSVVELAVARHQANARLRASEALFVNTLRSMAEGVISTDLLGKINFMNPVAEQLTGWSLAEASGRALGEVFRISTAAGQSLEPLGLGGAGGIGSARSMILTTKDGLPLLIEDNTAPIRDADGGLAGIVVLFRRREVAVASPEEVLAGASVDAPWPNLAGIVQSIADPLLALDAQWSITYLNSQAAAVLDGRRDDLLGKVLWDCLPPSLHRAYYHEFSQALTRKAARSFVLEHEAKKMWFEAQLYPFGGGLLTLLRDVTARKETEEQERKLEKLESLGLLARGFAHDFNNLLTVLLGNLSLVEMQMGNAPGRAELETAKQATLQAQGLVQHLLTFARGGAPIKQVTPLQSLVKNWFHAWQKRDFLDYRAEISTEVLLAEVDRQQFTRLLHNLMRNAEQAIPRTGVISLRLFPTSELADQLPVGALPAGANPADWLTLQIIDNGEGIPENHLAKVFEPYFTTREDANASGLGLTVCESIAKAHAATLVLASRAGEGTVVTLCLPRHYPPAVEDAGQSATTPAEAPTASRVRRILILEDEPLIRQIIVSTLRSASYHVDETADGVETVARYHQAMEAGQPYDLVIMDLSIPNGMGGAQAMEQLRQLDPGVKAIVSSGYSDDPVMSRHVDYGFRAVLPKPYEPRELRELVATLLAE